ncbi:hypothetical protein [Lactococcus garvieae]|uniref:hypothetical protein n=1 Tax=Lactococcus garvieae TaxID=1363 RepID=UPI0018D9972A|nr:hypothetical protein [Lactococcus garvieae]QPS70476.1 hypothetical protein I6G50_06765 [Lactococcus garvieae]
MLNKYLKKIVLVFVLILLLFSGVYPIFSIKVGAEAYTIVENETNENNEALFLGSEAEKLKEFHQQMNEVMITKQEGNQETAMISDADLVRILEKSGYKVSTEIKKIMFQRGTGVTKIVWYGNRKNGNYNLYLSKSMLQAIKYAQSGINVLSAAMSAFSGNLFMFTRGMIRATVNMIRANAIIHGKVFYSRAWIPRGSGNQ